MENVVITYRFCGDFSGYMIMSPEIYKALSEKFNLNEVLFDEDQNGWDVIPTSVSIDLYENPRLISKYNKSLEYEMGTNFEMDLEGNKIKNICKF